MAASPPLSFHYPQLAGNIVTVPSTGELTVDTGLRFLQTFVATIQSSNLGANEESLISWYPVNDGAPTRKVVIRIEKGGTSHGDIGDTAIAASWFALGI